MTAIKRARYPVRPSSAADRAFWLGRPIDGDAFEDRTEAYGEPLRFVRAPSAVISRVPQLCGFAVAGLLAGMLLATAITTLAPPPACDAVSLRPVAQWQPDGAAMHSVRGRVR